MNNELLRTFLELAKTRHFGHAADNLFLTQSAISSRIKQLEQNLGVELFTRHRNNILLTPAGERLLPHAENLLASWQLAVQEVGVPLKQNVQLSLGATSNLWDTFLVSMLPVLSKRFPTLYLRTEMIQAQHLTRGLIGGRLDACVVLDSPTNIELAACNIGQLELVMVATEPDHRLQDIPELGYVFVDWGTTFNLQQAKLFIEPVAPVLHTAQSYIAKEFLLNHKGAAYLPRTVVEPYIENRSLFLVEDAAQIQQEVHLVYQKQAEKSESLGPVIRHLGAKDVQDL